jgi:TolA-binding protein
MTSSLAPRILPCAALLAVMAFVPASHARAQDLTRGEIALQDQVLELRHDLDQLSQQVAANARRGGSGQSGSGQSMLGDQNQPPPAAGAAVPATDMTATLLDRVSRLEDQVRSISGRLDELQNAQQQQVADLTKQIGDLSFRVQTLEGGGTPPGAAPAGGTLQAPADAAPPPAAPARLTLQQGYAALARRDYKEAEQAAHDSMQGHAAHGYDAQFLLAQSYAGEHNYQQAALTFDDVYNKQRKGTHAPDSLLGLARSLADLGDHQAACATLDKLNREFPDQRPEVKAGAAAVGRHAACH